MCYLPTFTSGFPNFIKHLELSPQQTHRREAFRILSDTTHRENDSYERDKVLQQSYDLVELYTKFKSYVFTVL